jgi:hypothetical protein
MSGAEFSWTMHDHGLPLDKIPDTIARTVQLIIDDLQAAAAQAAGPDPHAIAWDVSAETSESAEDPYRRHV